MRSEMCANIVDAVSKWYSRRVWWLDRADMVQEGWVTALGIDSDAIVEDDHYRALLWRAVSCRLSRFCWEQSAPVTDRSHAGKHLAGARRVEITDFLDLSSGVDPETELLKQEAALLVPQYREELKERLTHLSTTGGLFPEVQMRAALSVLVDGVKPAAAAEQFAVDVASLYRTTEWVKTRAMRDATVKRILGSIVDRRADL